MKLLGEPKELTLSAGDLLYLPRGLIHEARASTETSLHLTVGVHAYTWGDLLRDALDNAIRQNETLRRSVATRLTPSSINCAELEQEFISIVEQLPNHVNIANTIKSKIAKDLKKWKRSFRGQIAQLERLSEVNRETLIRPRHACLCDVERDGDVVKVSVYDKAIKFPAFTENQIRYLLTQEQCRVCDLPPGLDAESQIVLVRRLIAEGIIEEVLC
jgi:ribosomal protein L16 Arg81 hydroxylase